MMTTSNMHTKYKYLDNSPLHSVVIELRFTTKIPEDAVPGILYSKINTVNAEPIQIVALPASQLPQSLRQQEPSLRYAPTQRLITPKMTINVGSNVLSLEANNARKSKTYPGWSDFFNQFKTLLKMMDFVSEIERVGLRYINVFNEERFFSKLNVSLKTGWESKGLTDGSNVIFFVEHSPIKSKVMIASDATIQDDAGSRKGQVIDIDTFVEGGVPTEDIEQRIQEAHDLTKEIFYSLPGDKLLAKMGPHSK